MKLDYSLVKIPGTPFSLGVPAMEVFMAEEEEDFRYLRCIFSLWCWNCGKFSLGCTEHWFCGFCPDCEEEERKGEWVLTEEKVS